MAPRFNRNDLYRALIALADAKGTKAIGVPDNIRNELPEYADVLGEYGVDEGIGLSLNYHNNSVVRFKPNSTCGWTVHSVEAGTIRDLYYMLNAATAMIELKLES